MALSQNYQQSFGIEAFRDFLRSDAYKFALDELFGVPSFIEGSWLPGVVAQWWHDPQFALDEGSATRGVLLATPPIGLLDALELWLVHGDGFDHSPDFETFLVSAMVIIDNWIENDRRGVCVTDGAPIWPHAAYLYAVRQLNSSLLDSVSSPQASQVPLASHESVHFDPAAMSDNLTAGVHDALQADQSPAVGTVLVDPEFAFQVATHQIVSRQHFQVLCAQHEKKQRDELSHRLDEIVAKLGISS